MPVQPEFSNYNELRSAVPLDALRRFARERRPAPSQGEHCEFCSALLFVEHRHLLDLSRRVILCACNECAVLFNHEGAGDGMYRAVPRRYLALADFQVSDEQWEQVTIPVNMLYIFESSLAQRVMAFYPGPAGATESLLDLEFWAELVAQNPLLLDLVKDVEALLINRIGSAREYYIVPIDECYRLVGLIRMHWHGLSGGQEVWTALEEFFSRLRIKSPVVSQNTVQKIVTL
jgi:Family of unknown function (DUF5947)